jgi:hypothetical protein
MLGKNIIQLQEELSYMPMQRLIDMVDDPNSIYGSLTLVEIKNREALQNSSTNMSPTPTVAEDVVSSVASPASTDLSSPNLSVEASGGIANLEQPQPPMQMMAEGRTVRLSDEMGEEFSLPPGGLMDLLPEGETPYLGDEEAITPEVFDELNKIEDEVEVEELLSMNRKSLDSNMPFDVNVDVGDDQIDSLGIARDNFRVNLNKQGNLRGEVDLDPRVTAFMNSQSEDENDMKAGIRAIFPFSTGGMGYAEGGEVETEEEDIKLFGKDGALFDPTNPVDYALAIPGLGALGLGAKGLSMAYKAYKAGKLSKKALAQLWKQVKNPVVGKQGPRNPGKTERFVGAMARYPKTTGVVGGIAGVGAYNALDPFAPEPPPPPSLPQRQSTSSLISSQLDEARDVFGYPTREEREAKDRRMLMMGLGSNIAGATNFNEIVQGNYDLMADQDARERSRIADDVAMVQGIQSLNPRTQRIAELSAAIKAMQDDPILAQSPQFQMLLQEYIALIQPQGASTNAPTGSEVLANRNPTLDDSFAQIDNA